MLTWDMKSPQNGNVLFLILIAVALFAALSYAVSSSSRSGNGTVSKEKAEAQAGRVLNFATAVQSAALRLSIGKGVTVQELKFNNDSVKRLDDNLAHGSLGSPADPSLYIFHPQGGGISPQLFEDLTRECIGCGSTQIKSGHFNFVWLNLPDTGTEQSDAVLLVIDINDDVCLAINKRIGIDFIPNVTFAGDILSSHLTPPSLTQVAGSTTADQEAIRGKLTYCSRKTNSPIRNNFITVLKAY